MNGLMNNIILNYQYKKQIRDSLHGFVTARERIYFLKKQKKNLSKTDMIITNSNKYTKILKYLNDQININEYIIDEEDYFFDEVIYKQKR